MGAPESKSEFRASMKMLPGIQIGIVAYFSYSIPPYQQNNVQGAYSCSGMQFFPAGQRLWLQGMISFEMRIWIKQA